MKKYPVLAYGLTAALAVVACGKKDDKKSDAPAPVTTTVSTTRDGNNVNFEYTSNVQGAKFLCKVEINGQAAGDWGTCPPSLQLEPGKSVVVTAKAIAPNGAEGATSQTRPLLLTGNGTPTNAPQTGGLVTQILNKAEVGDVYTRGTLRVNFGLSGGAPASLDDIRYECKRESEQDFRRCPDNDTYDFGMLTNNQSYSLDVRAVIRSTNAVAGSDRIAFRVQLANCATPTGGQPQVGQPGQQVGGQPGQPVGGQPGQPVGGQPGQPGQQTGPQVPVDQCGQPVGGTGGTAAPAPGPQSLQIGKSYAYTLSPGQHVTEYSTTETPNRALEYYHVTMDSDPYYLGSYACDPYINGGQPFPIVSPAGNAYNYCMSVPPQEVFKKITDYRIAFNHLEVATDAQVVNDFTHDYISFNAYDTVTIDAMQPLTRFTQLCAGRQIYKTPSIRFIDRGFWAEKVTATLYMCNTDLVIRNGYGLPFRNPLPWQNGWWVGAFFMTSEARDLPLMECWFPGHEPEYVDAQIADASYGAHHAPTPVTPDYCGSVRFPNLLEMTFVSKTPNQRPELFAREVQGKLVKQLEEIVPMLHP